jgi:hypothetical protein
MCIGLEIPFLNMPADSNGHYAVYDAGQHGLEQAFIPFTPYFRINNCTTIGRVEKRPVVVGEEVLIQDMMNKTSTGDHRFGDAAIWTPLHKVMLGYSVDAKNFKTEDYAERPHWSEKKSQ